MKWTKEMQDVMKAIRAINKSMSILRKCEKSTSPYLKTDGVKSMTVIIKGEIIDLYLKTETLIESGTKITED